MLSILSATLTAHDKYEGYHGFRFIHTVEAL